MITRGVPSVRSPVKNLQEFSPAVTHDKFLQAMVRAFREEYHVEEPVRPCHNIISIAFLIIVPRVQVQYVQAEDATNVPYIQDSMANFPVGLLTVAL
jgi:hypothetical protein